MDFAQRIITEHMLRNAALILLLPLVLNACGTRGPLYLPSPQDQKPAQQEPARK